MIITIKSVNDETKGENHWKSVTFMEGGEERKKHIFLTEKYPLLVAGSTVELVMSKSFKDGKTVWNIADIKPATAQQAVTEDKSSDFATFHLRQKSIERQNALTNAVNFWSRGNAGEISIQQILYTAEDFFNWTSQGLIPASLLTNEKLIEQARTVHELPIPPVIISPPTLQEATEAFNAMPSMSVKTPEDFKKSVNNFCRQNKWNKKDLENFMKAHEKKLGGKTDASLLDTAEQAILLTLLMKEVKDVK